MAQHAELVLAMSVVLGLACLAWVVLAWPLALWPRASVRFAIANAQLAISLQLVLMRGSAPDWQAWPLADLIGLTAFFLLHGGVRHLFGMRTWSRLELLLFGLVVLLYLVLPPGPESRAHYRSLYSLTAGGLCAVMAWLLWVGARRAIDARAAWAFALPFGVAALLMAWRLLQLAQHPGGALGGDRMAVVWAVFLLCLCINLSLAACVLTRLVLMVRRQAERDPLTGLYNRRSLQQRLQQERARSLRRAQVFALATLDIDHFKQINDRHGHAAGDAALCHLAALLQQQLRVSDLLARSGGEEFVVLMPDTGGEAAAQVAERMRAALEAHPLQWEGLSIPVRASFGVADSGQASDDDGLLRAADQALYAAKEGGRNQVRLAPA